MSGSAGNACTQAVIGYIARVGLEHFGDFAVSAHHSKRFHLRLVEYLIEGRGPHSRTRARFHLFAICLFTMDLSATHYFEPSAYHFTPGGGIVSFTEPEPV